MTGKSVVNWLASVAMILAAAAVLASAGGAGSASAAGLGEVTAGIPKWNALAIPLQLSTINQSSQIANFIATGDPATPGSGILRVMKWNGTRWLEYFPQAPFLGDPDFPIATGDSLMLLIDNSISKTAISWVGSVPNVNSIKYSLASSKWNAVMIPLDQHGTFGSPSSPTGTAATLALSMNNQILRVMYWNSTNGRWFEYFPDAPFLGDADFPVYLGHPYMVLTKSTPPAQWP